MTASTPNLHLLMSNWTRQATGLSTPGYPDGHAEELLVSTSCAGDCNARPTSSLFIARSGGRKSCAGAAAGARAWARAAGLGGGEANPTRPRSATIIPAPRFGRGGSIAGVDDSALRQRADLQALSAILLESWNELSRGMRTTRWARCKGRCRRHESGANAVARLCCL